MTVDWILASQVSMKWWWVGGASVQAITNNSNSALVYMSRRTRKDRLVARPGADDDDGFPDLFPFPFPVTAPDEEGVGVEPFLLWLLSVVVVPGLAAPFLPWPFAGGVV
jgi:hypothetical protein